MGRVVKLASGQATVLSAGTAVQLENNCILSVTIKANAANVGSIYIGGSNVASNTGFVLAAGEAISIDIDNLNDIWMDASSSGDGVSYLKGNKMAELSDYFENSILNQLRNVAGVQVAAYVALFTAVTGLESDAPTAEVPTAGGTLYARQLAGLTEATGAGGATSNAANIVFPTAGASWGTVTHVALVDHATNVTWGTNVHVLMWSALDTEKAIDIGDTFQINAGDLDVTIA